MRLEVDDFGVLLQGPCAVAVSALAFTAISERITTLSLRRAVVCFMSALGVGKSSVFTRVRCVECA